MNDYKHNITVMRSLMSYRDQTWFFKHSPGPVGSVENRGRRPRFSTPPMGPGENVNALKIHVRSILLHIN